MCFRLLNALWHDTEGSVLLEATVLTPVLLVLFLGAYEFSWYFNRQQLVETGVRDAARYLGAASPNPCGDSTLLANAQNIATTNSDGTARVPGWGTSDVSISCTTIDNSANNYYCPATAIPTPVCHSVTVQTSFADPSILNNGVRFFSFLHLPTPNLSFSHTERANNSSSP
jgi:Flp pilus assembly protein TadG